MVGRLPIIETLIKAGADLNIAGTVRQPGSVSACVQQRCVSLYEYSLLLIYVFSTGIGRLYGPHLFSYVQPVQLVAGPDRSRR
jgi:hypothetical protein